MSQPGTSGWVCIKTNDGESYCQKFSRRVFETANTLAAPGELCTPNYISDFPKYHCDYGPIDPSKFKKFDD